MKKILLFLFTVGVAFGARLSVWGSTAPATTLPYTGDHGPYLLIAVVMGVALVAIIILLITMKKKK